jgi:hypothetical protein
MTWLDLSFKSSLALAIRRRVEVSGSYVCAHSVNAKPSDAVRLLSQKAFTLGFTSPTTAAARGEPGNPWPCKALRPWNCQRQMS